MKDPLKDYWFQVEIQKSPYGNIEIFAHLDMTEKKIEIAISPNYIMATLIFFWWALDPFGTFRPPQKILILFY